MKPLRHARRNWVLPMLGGVLLVAVAVMIAALCIPRTAAFLPPAFVPPAPDEHAVQGVPVVEERFVYRELYREGMAYRISVCWAPGLDGAELIVNLTNPAVNDCLLKLRVLDADGSLLGETGLLRPGEYVRAVTLSKALAPGADVRLKVMGYEPETYHSAGAFSMNFTVQSVD